MFNPIWGAITIDEPVRFVDAHGNVILAMHFQPGSNGVIDNIWLSMTAIDVHAKSLSKPGRKLVEIVCHSWVIEVFELVIR